MAFALVLAVASGVAATPAVAANNPGTGDSGFFTFRPTTQSAGSQVNVASGNLLVRARDLVNSLLNYGVVVDRAYNSLASNSFSILSPRWSFDVGPSTKITEQPGGNAVVDGPSGYNITFAHQTDGTYVSPLGFDGSLAKTPGGWTLLRNSHSDQFGFDNQGILSTTKDAQARDFTVQNTSAAGRTVLSSYGTSSGRRVNLSYTGDSLVREMDNPASGHHYYTYTAGKLTGYQDPVGPQTAYHYDANGLLDKITQPDGTTVNLVMHSSGKIQSTTSTAPGGTGQTTSFVYVRRTYKTDVTAPSGVRRTYAYDDDWRVTRQYNPDVTPTVTASGDLRDRADQYVNGNQTYPVTIAADEPDGAGLTHLGLERTGGTEIVGDHPLCTDTPFDHICPTSFTAPLQADLSSVPEGRQTLRGTATDDEQHHESSTAWDVLVDRTAPPAATDVRLGYYDPADSGKVATIDWNTDDDPPLPDGSRGSGAAAAQVRYRVNGGSFGAWAPSAEDTLDVANVNVGDQITVEVRATDSVGNHAASAVATVTVGEQLEDPDVEAAAAQSYVDEYGGSLGQATAWMRVQARTDDPDRGDLDSELSDSSDHGYAGVWFDNAQKKITVNVTAGTPHAPMQAVLAQRGLAGDAAIRDVDYTQAQLEQAQPDIEGSLSDLLDQGLIGIARITSANAIRITVTSSVTVSQRARVQQAASAAAVRVEVVDVPETSLAGQPLRCKFPNCDPPLRGGLKISTPASGGMSRLCTNGFLATSPAGSRFQITAGHCTRGAGSWSRFDPDLPNTTFPFGETSTTVFDARGDAGLIRLNPGIADAALSAVLVTKSKTDGPVQTRRNPHYKIRGSGPNREGMYVCMSGTKSGTRCGRVEELNSSAKPTGEDFTIKNAALVRICAIPGDSGSPVYRGGVAYGIVSTQKTDIFTSCTGFYMTGARIAESLLNVKIGG